MFYISFKSRKEAYPIKNSFLKLLLSSSLIVGSTITSFNSTPIKAASFFEPVVTACDYSIAPIPEEGEAILLEDLSYTEPQLADLIARSPSRVNVNQTYAIEFRMSAVVVYQARK